MLCLRARAHIHMIALCGTAMGSLAGMLKECGFRITGSDAHVYPPMSTFLRERGIEVQPGFDPARLEPPPDLVIVGNAVSRGNPEVEATLDRKLHYASLPEVLRDLFIRGRRSVVVTGTHGKTTTAALAAHLLSQGGLDPSFMVAGLPRNFPRPYALGRGEFFVVEGDEYDSAFFAKWAKFFYYLPEILVINNIEFDHADIYDNLDEIARAFRRLVNLVPAGGLVLAHGEDPVVAGLLPASPAPVQTFGLGKEAHWRAVRIESGPGGQRFDLLCRGEFAGRFRLPLNGIYNVRNALAAIGVAFAAGLSAAKIREGLCGFAGVKRRQEHLGTVAGIALVDDFAHHPTSVAQTLEGLRQAHPGGRLWVAFEPASATNARDLFEESYLEAFAPAHGVVVARVPRPERARDQPPFSPERLVEGLRRLGKEAVCGADPEQIAAYLLLRVRPGDLVVFMSNGAFGGLQHTFFSALEKRYGDKN